jgi:alanine transaminase
VKALVIINPGNPTGAILSADSIKKIIEFAVKNRLPLIIDEVYRENTYEK